MSPNRAVHLMPSGEVVTANVSTWRDSYDRIEVPKSGAAGPRGADTHWTWYVRARAGDRFNSRSHELLSDERWFVYKEINQLPGLVREARGTAEARRAGAEKARADEQAQVRQNRRDAVRKVIYGILLLAVVAVVLAIVLR